MYRNFSNRYSEYESLFKESESQESDSRPDDSVTESKFDLFKNYFVFIVSIVKFNSLIFGLIGYKNQIMEIEEMQQLIVRLNKEVREIAHKNRFHKIYFFIMVVYGLCLISDLMLYFFKNESKK